MEQNAHKFRIRLNLFDAIVLIVVLLAGAAFAWLSLRSGDSSGTAATSQTVRYTVVFQKMAKGDSQLIQAGDKLEDAVKNYSIGTVVSVETKPAVTQILDQEERCYVDAELAGYEDVYVTVESACTDNGEPLLLGGGYDFRVGKTAYVRGPGYKGSGPVTAIERGNEG